MSRVMALDYGTKAIGVAVSDELRLTARPLTTLKTTVRRQKLSDAQVAACVVELVTEYEVGLLLVGLPLNMDGTRGAAVAKVERFVAQLQARTDVPIKMMDERLTSREADERLREQGADARERKAKSDEYAALILLEDFLAGTA
jgi:putative holliday junction resolvase